MAAAPGVAAPGAGRAQRLHAAGGRAIRHRRAAVGRGAAGRARAGAAGAAAAGRAGGAARAWRRRGSWWRASCANARRTRISRLRQRVAAGPGGGVVLARADLGPDRRGEVDRSRPGHGKTRVLATAARAWGGPVFGTATSQNATNELRNAGVRVAANTTRLLADLDAIPPGSLIEVDEGSMRVPGPPGRAGGARGAERLQAGAGRGSGAARRRGRRRRDDAAGATGSDVRAVWPSRSGARSWEREPRCGCGAGATARDDYDQHGRIRGRPARAAPWTRRGTCLRGQLPGRGGTSC